MVDDGTGGRAMSADAPRPADVWASGAAYEPYVGRWSRLVAREFLTWLAVPPGCRWLDVGCGTGALSQTIAAESSPAGVNGVDASADYVAFARQMFLSEERRAALRERIRVGLPVAADGAIPLMARAWAVRGAREARGSA